MTDEDQFYELNAQCWRCRMYVPRMEMKYYAGMLYCPMCYNDVAEANRCQLCGKHLETGEHGLCGACKERKKQKEKCSRCGSSLEEGVCPNCSRERPERGEGQAPEEKQSAAPILSPIRIVRNFWDFAKGLVIPREGWGIRARIRRKFGKQ